MLTTMITVKQKLTNMLIERGMFESQAEAVMNLALPTLNKQAENVNGTEMQDNIEVPVAPYVITWDAPATDYPSVMYALWFASIKPIALKWIDENKPQAWFREMFV